MATPPSGSTGSSPSETSSTSGPDASAPDPSPNDTLADRVSEIWAAGLGALDEAQKQGSTRFDALVERGRQMREKGGSAVQHAIARVETTASGAVESAKETGGGVAEAVSSRFEHAVEAVLATVRLPKWGEADALRAQIDTLQARLDRLIESGAVERTVYEVAPHEDGWQVREAGAGRAASVHRTKKEALQAGRQRAKGAAPSRLVAFKTDGTAGETVEYDA